MSLVLSLCSGLILGAQTPSPAKLISEMFAVYANARTVSGSIVMRQSVGQQGGALETKVAIQRPDKLYIFQQRHTKSGTTWLAVADGNRFSYDEPFKEQVPGKPKRLIESQRPGGKQIPLTEVYAALTHSLADHSEVLDITVSRNEDLRAITQQWVNMKYAGEADHNGERVDVILGEWRQYGDAPITGKFRMWLAKDRSLRSYSVEEMMQLGGAAQPVISSWQVNLKLNEAVDASLFTVRL